MKKIASLFSFFVIIIQPMLSQNIKSVVVEYQQKMNIDEEKISQYPESIQQVLRAKAKWEPAILVHTDKGSYYTTQDKIETKTTQHDARKKTTVKSGNKCYFKNFESNNLYTQYEMYNETVIIEDKLMKYDWKLESEEKIIDNIKCKKASTVDSNGKQITVWYTDKFGINNGPADYHGLPGLIVYAEDGKYSYKMSKIEFSEKDVALLKPSEDGVKVTPEEYEKLYVNRKENETRKGNKITTRRVIQN